MKLRPTLFSKPDTADVGNVVDHAADLNTDTGSTIRLGFITLVIGFCGFLLWAAFAPLDEGVPAPAVVTIDTKRKTIQHMTGGSVLRVVVREGQRVKTGDLLVELDDGATRANFESIRQTYMAQRAAESRLLAEIGGRSSISFHSDLMEASSDPLIKQHVFSQVQLFESRRAAIRAELAAIDESIASQEATLNGNQLQIESRKLQAQKLAEQLANMASLASEGYIPRNQVLQMEQTQAELKAVMAELSASKTRAERSIAELKMRKSLRLMDSTKESATQLADVRREVQSGRERLDAITAELSRIRIKAPVDGQVVGLSIASVGGVVTPGQRLMDIVPDNEGVVLEARIPTNVIDRVRSG